MSYWWFVIIIVNLVLLGLIFWKVVHELGKAERISYTSLVSRFDSLLARGYHGGFVIFEAKKGPHFLQVQKYITDGDYGIELGFPDAEWSKAYVPEVVSLAKEFNLTIVKTKKLKEGLSFVYVDFHQDIEVAAKYCNSIVQKIFKLPEDAKFEYGFTRIDYDKDYPQISDHPKGFVFYDRH